MQRPRGARRLSSPPLLVAMGAVPSCRAGCVNWPEDAPSAQSELHAHGAAPWLFKDTSGSSGRGGDRTYGGLEISFYSPATDRTKRLVVGVDGVVATAG